MVRGAKRLTGFTGCSLAAGFITDRLNRAAELDLSLVRKSNAVVALQDGRHSTLSGLTIHADQRFIRAADFLRIDRKIRHAPGSDGILSGQSLPDRVLMRAGEGGKHEGTGVRM